MINNKYLQVSKENIFIKFISFINKLFRTKKNEKIDATIPSENRINQKNDYMNEIQLSKQENNESIELQKEFENGNINLSMLSNEEIHSLNLLYDRQINDLKKEIDNKKTEVNMLKLKIKNY